MGCNPCEVFQLLGESSNGSLDGLFDVYFLSNVDVISASSENYKVG